MPRVLVLTDTVRGFDLETQTKAWPIGAGFVERTYGHMPSKAIKFIRTTRYPTFQMATCTPKQARALGLNGVHWPHNKLRFRKRSDVQGLVETCSAHGGLDIARAHQQGITTVLLSAVFASQSPSVGKPLGPIRLAILCRRFPNMSIYGLAGVSERTIKRLAHTGISGIAGVSFVS